MSSPYAVLDNRSLDQWKVVELREELKKRKLTTKGLKEDLVKRLDEAVRIERESSTKDADDDSLSGIPPEDAEEEALVSQEADDSTEIAMEAVHNVASTGVGVDLVQDVTGTQAEVTVHVAAESSHGSEQLADVDQNKMPVASAIRPNSPCIGTPSEEDTTSSAKMENDDIEQSLPEPDIEPFTHQVPEVDPDSGFQVTSNSVSTESIAVIEKNELMVDLITENNQLEIKAEIVQPSLSSDAPDSVDVKKQLDDSMNDAGITKIIDTGDLGSEKLNLDRSSGDDSMEEDALDTKHLDVEPELSKGIDDMDKSLFSNQVEDENVDVIGHYNPNETEAVDAEKGTSSESSSVKRKLPDPTSNNEPVKKAPRWNTGGLKNSVLQSGGDSAVGTEQPRERIVPPSSKPPTNSLRIDRFLRPFTLKAVQELLGRTGTVTSFWMDLIKTHCYVSYSSVEEAEKTRDAVYNLQWPPNGGRLLVAEFVESEEVKARLDPSSSSAAMNAAPADTNQPQSTKPTAPLPAQRQQRHHPSREPLARDQPLPARDQFELPPPPPLQEGVDPPTATLDDFFRKTRSSPRIYYLPLSDEQVAEKLGTPGKNAQQ